ncbi:hypothetical protein ScPMuIL_015530 [Solemya velum]
MEDIIAGGDFQKLKVTDLKKILKERGLSQSGTKSELIERLQSSVSLSVEDALVPDVTEKEENLEHIEHVEAQEEEEEDGEEESEEVQNTVEEWKGDIKKEEDLLSLTPEKPAEVTKLTKIVFEETKPTATTPQKDGDKSELLKKRAERFGAVSSEPIAKSENVELLKKRAERFGTVASATLAKVVEKDRLQKRKERFGNSTVATGTVSLGNNLDDIEIKKRKRAERFALS